MTLPSIPRKSPGRFYLLHEGAAGSAFDRIEIVRSACQRAGVDFIALDSLTANYTRLPVLQRGDMLFNSGRGSSHLETLLTQPHTATFRTSLSRTVTNTHDSTIYSASLEREGFPVPRTIYGLPPDRGAIQKSVTYLGGFPIVIKIVGGSLGLGVMIVESMRSLLSVTDYLRTTGNRFLLRQYIEPAHLGRILILGDEAIASMKYYIPVDDFRGPRRQPSGGITLRSNRDSELPPDDGVAGGIEMEFPLPVVELMRRVARCCEYEFTGVDFVVDHQGNPFVLEANPPSNFVAAERDLGIPIGDKIVNYLLAKASRYANQL